MPSWQSTSRIGCLINNPARRSRGAISPTRPQWTRVPLDFRPRWRYVVNKAGAASAAPALKYKFYFTPHFCGYTEFGIVPALNLLMNFSCGQAFCNILVNAQLKLMCCETQSDIAKGQGKIPAPLLSCRSGYC